MINDYYLSKPDNFQEQTHLFLDDFDHPVRWKGKNISNLFGSKVYLRFFMRNAFVFGFRFGK